MGSSLRGKPARDRTLMDELTTQRFADETKNLETSRRAALIKDAELAAQKMKDRRALMLQDERRKEEDTKQAEEELIAYHRQTLERKRAQERQELRVELALLHKAEQKRWAAKEASLRDASQGIEGFETNLRRLGLDADAEAEADSIVPIEGNSPHETLRKILGKLPPTGTVEQSGREYLERIKRRKAEETQARKERERRRRKIVVEQALALATVQEARQAVAASGALARASRAEERMRAHLDALRLEKETIVANRQQREKEYAEQREREWQEALERDRQQGRENRAAYAQRAVVEARRHEEEKRKRKAEKRKKVEEACQDIVKQLVGLTEMTVDYREAADTTALLPRSMWREWKALFTSGAQLYIPMDSAKAKEGEEVEDTDPRDEESLRDYIASRGDWAASPAEGSSTARALDEVWQGALKAAAAPPVPEAGKLNVALKLAVTGTPFAGKTSVAKALAARYNLALINPDDLVTKAVAAAEQDQQARALEEGAPPSGDLSLDTPSPLVALGCEAQAAIASTGHVSDDVTLRLILHAIKTLPSPQPPPNPSPSLAKGDSKNAGKNARTKAPSPTPAAESTDATLLPSDMPCGFVIDGYPRTEEEARRLERALTGLDLEAEERRRAERPRLLPEEKAPEEVPILASGLDKIFVCTLADDAEALKRALGRRVDPTTGKMYHLEYSPPSEEDKIIIHGRLVDPSPDRSTNGASLYQSASATWPSVSAWLARFGSAVMELNVTEALAAAEKTAIETAETVLKIKAKARAAEAAAKAAEKAAEQVATCTAAAEAASRAATEAAAALYRAKRAQQEASTGLQPEETRLVGEAAAGDLHALLKQAAKAKEEAETAKQAAIEAAKVARAAADSACSAAADVGTATTAAEDAVRAQVDAESARAKAEASRERAEKASGEAEKLWRKAERMATGEAEPAEGDGTEGASGRETPATSLPPVPPAPVPLSSQDFVALLEAWRNMEAEYCASVRAGLRKCREEREKAVADCRAVKKEFVDFLNRQDGKQRIVDEFQEEFNEVDARLRFNHSMKEELAEKVAELRDALWQECDARREESGREKAAQAAKGRVGSHVAEIASAHAELAQKEFSRLLSTLTFLQSYHARCYSLQEPSLLPDLSSMTEASPLPTDPDWLSTAVPALSGIARRTLQAFKVAKTSLNDVINPVEKKDAAGPSRQGSNVDPKGAKSGKRVSEVGRPAGTRSGKKGDKAAAAEARESPETPPVDALVDPEILARRECARALLAAVEEEGARATERLRQLTEAAARDMQAVKEMEARAFARLEEWIAERFKAECVAVTSVVDMANAAVEEGIALWYKLTIQRERFDVDEATLMMECPPPAPPPEPAPAPGIMPVDSLDALAAFFADTAPSGHIPLHSATESVPRIARECFETRSNPANQPVAPSLPGRQKAAISTGEKKGEDMWVDASEETVQACCVPFSAGGTVSWRRFLSCLVTENSAGTIASGTPDDFGRARARLQRADTDEDGKLTYEEWMKVGLWFEKDDGSSGYKRGAALKAVLFRMCADPDESLVTWQTLLQYLCCQSQPATWLLERAAAAIGASPPDYAVSAEQISQLLSWDGPPADASLGLPALVNLVQTLSGGAFSGDVNLPRVPISELSGNLAFAPIYEALQRLYTWTPCGPIVVENRARDLELARVTREARSSVGSSEGLSASRKGNPPAGQKGRAPEKAQARGPSPTPQKGPKIAPKSGKK